jgi:acetyl-CoA carboxylase biotin carboxyl carrier protein
MDFAVIEKLTSLAKSSGVTVIEVEENGTKIRIENGAIVLNSGFAPTTASSSAAAPVASAPQANDPATSGFYYISSPLVGIFCSLEKMSKSNFAEGDNIDVDTLVCGVEAMKLICDVKSDVKGTFVEYLVKDGDQVEFGQSLVKIKI